MNEFFLQYITNFWNFCRSNIYVFIVMQISVMERGREMFYNCKVEKFY